MKNYTSLYRLLSILLVGVFVVGCANKSSVPKTNEGRYKVVKDYGPDEKIDVSHVQNAIPKVESLSPGGNRSRYQVLGKEYSVLPAAAGYSETGGASWYGKKFHGYLTANGEKYDMFGMSAAHKSLPIPTYVKVTNLANNRHVIVRVNDRGPFHKGRIIDLSYAAASKLDMLKQGTSQVRVEAINPQTWQQNNIANAPSKASAKAVSLAKNVDQEREAITQFLMTSANKPIVVDNLKPAAINKAVAPAINSAQLSLIKEPNIESVDKVQPVTKKVKTKPRSDRYRAIHYVQVGVYSTEEAAHAVTLKVNEYDLPVLISEVTRRGKYLFKVVLGPVKSRSKTRELTEELAQNGFPGAHLVDLPK